MCINLGALTVLFAVAVLSYCQEVGLTPRFDLCTTVRNFLYSRSHPKRPKTHDTAVGAATASGAATLEAAADMDVGDGTVEAATAVHAIAVDVGDFTVQAATAVDVVDGMVETPTAVDGGDGAVEAAMVDGGVVGQAPKTTPTETGKASGTIITTWNAIPVVAQTEGFASSSSFNMFPGIGPLPPACTPVIDTDGLCLKPTTFLSKRPTEKFSNYFQS